MLSLNNAIMDALECLQDGDIEQAYDNWESYTRMRSEGGSEPYRGADCDAAHVFREVSCFRVLH